VSDQPANPDGQGKEASSEAIVLEIDRTPPEIAVEREQDGSLRVSVRDGASAVSLVEVLEDGLVRFTAAPDDGVADSAKESYRLSPSPGAERRVLRVTDAAGNAVERPLSGP
jgi:hypothetical protein